MATKKWANHLGFRRNAIGYFRENKTIILYSCEKTHSKFSRNPKKELIFSSRHLGLEIHMNPLTNHWYAADSGVSPEIARSARKAHDRAFSAAWTPLPGRTREPRKLGAKRIAEWGLRIL